jgi:nucleotide-binding universal stress UspA family protein
LTQGRPWHPQARFAAAIDLMDSHRPQLSHVISRTIVSLRGACGADLDLLYAQPDGLPDAPAMARSLLQALLPEVAPAAARVHLLEGDAKQVLPGFAQERDYDLIAVGMLREASFACYLRSLLAQLLRSLRGDVLIVKPEG